MDHNHPNFGNFNPRFPQNNLNHQMSQNSSNIPNTSQIDPSILNNRNVQAFLQILTNNQSHQTNPNNQTGAEPGFI